MNTSFSSDLSREGSSLQFIFKVGDFNNTVTLLPALGHALMLIYQIVKYWRQFRFRFKIIRLFIILQWNANMTGMQKEPFAAP